MGWRERKLEIGIVAIGIVLFGFISLSTQRQFSTEPNGFFKNFQLGFEMPKFRNLRKLFSLDGREIKRYEQREHIANFDDQKNSNKSIAVANSATNAAKPNGSVKTAIADKKGNVAKSPVQSPAKRGQLRTNIVSGGDRFKSAFSKSSSGVDTRSREAVAPPVAPQGFSGGVVNLEDPAVATKKDDKELGLDYWKSLILAQPTSATAYKIVDALAKKKISEKDFYTLSEMLMQSPTPGFQKLGLYMVYNQNNASAFGVVAKNFDKFQGELVSVAENYFMSYNQVSRIGVLGSVLSVANTKIQLIALTTVMSGLQKIRNGELPFPVDPRHRGVRAQAFQVNSYNQLLPQLEKLATHSETQISQSAIDTIRLLQSVASN